jgi:hypothetical protein
VITKKDDTADILSELDNELSKDEKVIVSDNKTEKQVESTLDEKKSVDKIETNKEEVPDWLKGNFSDDSGDKKSDEKNTQASKIIESKNTETEGKNIDKSEKKE